MEFDFCAICLKAAATKKDGGDEHDAEGLLTHDELLDHLSTVTGVEKGKVKNIFDSLMRY